MARQPMSMLGHMYAAANKTLKIAAAPVLFVGRAAGQALERLIPHGASELGQALYGGGSAYAPPGVTERLTRPDLGNVHGTGQAQVQTAQPQQSAVQAPAVTPPSQQQALGGNQYYVQPQTHEQALQQAAARGANRPQERGRER